MKPDDNLREALQAWRKGEASLEAIRSMALDIGHRHYAAGITALVQLLDHQDDIVRYNAALSLGFELHHTRSGEKLLRMLEADPDVDCRGVAAGALGNLFQNSKDRGVVAALAKAALGDPDEYVRSSAYKGLQVVNGVSREQRLEMLRSDDLSVDPERVRAILQDVCR